MTTPEQLVRNAEKARKYRASPAGKAYRQTPEYKEYKKQWKRKQRATPEGKLKEQRYSFKSALKTLYGLTLEDWDGMLIVQSGRCALCGEPMQPNDKEPTVDHDHKTNKVRGLIHNNCNLGLGHFKESVETLQQAINYLQSFT